MPDMKIPALLLKWWFYVLVLPIGYALLWIAALILFVIGMGPDYTEEHRISSPDGKYEALVIDCSPALNLWQCATVVKPGEINTRWERKRLCRDDNYEHKVVVSGFLKAKWDGPRDISLDCSSNRDYRDTLLWTGDSADSADYVTMNLVCKCKGKNDP